METLLSRFAGDLVSAVEAGCREGAEKVVLLSGGVDSLTCLMIALRLWGVDGVRTITIEGLKTYDSRKALATAKFYGVRNDVATVNLNALVPVIAKESSGTGYTSLFEALVHASLKVAFAQVSIDGADVITGEGADGLYGSTGSFAYIGAKKLAAEKGIAVDEALSIMRWKEQKRTKKTQTQVWKDGINEAGGNWVMPFIAQSYPYIRQATFGEIRPRDKRFARDLLVKEFGVPLHVAKRKRQNMQGGTGLYELLGKELMEKTGAQSPNAAVKELCR